MKFLKSIRTIAATIALALLALMIAPPAHAGVKAAVTAVTNETNVVAAFAPGLGNAVKGTVFLANYDVYHITDRFALTVGVDIRAENGWISQFSNVGIGGGVKFVIKEPISIHLGYAQSLTGVPNGVAAGRAYAGIGFGKK